MVHGRRLTFGIILSLSLGLWLVWEWNRQIRSPKDDILATEMRELAGPNATDCGHVPSGDDRSAADACVLALYKAKKPFKVRYGPYRADSEVHTHVTEALVGTPKGHIYLLNHGYRPDGLPIEKMISMKCYDPVIVSKKGKPRLECKIH